MSIGAPRARRGLDRRPTKHDGERGGLLAEPLKDQYGPEVIDRIAGMISPVYPKFDTDSFIAAANDGFEELELTPRARHIADSLVDHLPEGFEEAAPILVESLGPPIEGDEVMGLGLDAFLYLPHVFYIADRGRGHWDTAMWAQYQLTQRLTCEFSIRVFIIDEPDRTLARLREWASDANPHVRRLVSEGTRPRLPWAPRLPAFVADPTSVIELLELLKDDPAAMVRRSVANNLNDIGKDHPDRLVEVCRGWSIDASPERQSLIRHALRTAVKRGDPAALAILGFGTGDTAHVSGGEIEPTRPVIGGHVKVGLTLRNVGETKSAYNVDLKVHFVKANGSTSPKVSKVRQVELTPDQEVRLTKRISVAQHTTRTPHPGEHLVEAVVNGKVVSLGGFLLETRTAP